MLKRALVLGLSVMAALPAFAANVASRTGTVGTMFNVTPGESTSMAVNWTQAAGTTYTGITVAPLLATSSSGTAATGSAYLSSGIGATATVIAGPVAFTVPGTQTTPTATTISFPGATLAGGVTYYLTISNGSATLLWGGVTTAATESMGTGVTAIGADLQDLASPQPSNPPTSATFSTPVTTGGGAITHVLLFSVSGTLGGGGGGTPPIPTLGEWAIFGTVLLLGVSGCLLLRRRQA